MILMHGSYLMKSQHHGRSVPRADPHAVYGEFVNMLLTILLYDALGEFSTQNQDMNLHTHFGQLLTDTGCTLGETSKSGS